MTSTLLTTRRLILCRLTPRLNLTPRSHPCAPDKSKITFNLENHRKRSRHSEPNSLPKTLPMLKCQLQCLLCKPNVTPWHNNLLKWREKWRENVLIIVHRLPNWNQNLPGSWNNSRLSWMPNCLWSSRLPATRNSWKEKNRGDLDSDHLWNNPSVHNPKAPPPLLTSSHDPVSMARPSCIDLLAYHTFTYCR